MATHKMSLITESRPWTILVHFSGKAFALKAQYTNHIVLVHSYPKPPPKRVRSTPKKRLEQCPLCNKCVDRSNMKGHIKTHSGKINFLIVAI